MTKQAIIYILVLLVGLAVGTGLGYFLTKPKIDAANTTAAEAMTKLTEVQSQSEADLKTANAKLARYETDLKKSRSDLMSKNTVLLRTQTELARAKAVLEQALQQQPGGETTAAKTSAPTPAKTTATRTPVASGPAREYTIKAGDSLWKIAATELGDGARWTEIDELNPDVDQNTTLKVGSKINIPAK